MPEWIWSKTEEPKTEEPMATEIPPHLLERSRKVRAAAATPTDLPYAATKTEWRGVKAVEPEPEPTPEPEKPAGVPVQVKLFHDGTTTMPWRWSVSIYDETVKPPRYGTRYPVLSDGGYCSWKSGAKWKIWWRSRSLVRQYKKIPPSGSREENYVIHL